MCVREREGQTEADRDKQRQTEHYERKRQLISIFLTPTNGNCLSG